MKGIKKGWFTKAAFKKVYTDLKQTVLTQPDMAVDIKKMMQLNRGASIDSKAMGFYDTLGMEVPDLYMMDGVQRLHALTQFRKDYDRLKTEYQDALLNNRNAALEKHRASKPSTAPISEQQPTNKPA